MFPVDVSVALIGFAGAELERAMRSAAKPGSVVVVLTDDRDLLPEIPRVTVLEPEDLIPDGTQALGETWDPAMANWLLKLFGSERLARLMSVDVQIQPAFTERNLAVSVSRRFFQRYRPEIVQPIGPLPSMFAIVPVEARAHGLAVASTANPWRKWPVGLGMSAAMIVRHSAQFARRVRGRKKARKRLGRIELDGSMGTPVVWLAFSPTWYQSSRHIIETLLIPFDQRRTPYGILFIETFGERPAQVESNADEMSVFDGRLANARPAAVEQVSGVEDARRALGVWLRWLPLAVTTCLRSIRNVEDLRVGELPASRPEDLRSLLSVGTQGVLRMMDAERAAQDWLRLRKPPGLVVFSRAPSAEVKVFDEMLQSSGTTTVDFAHGSASESNLRTIWRSSSTYHVSWTLQERDIFERMGTNRFCLGGYMPRLIVPARAAHRKPRVLAVTAYFHKYWLVDGHLTTAKHGRRLATCLLALAEHLGDRAEVVLRPHPHEDRQPWERLFADQANAPRLSTVAALPEDLAEADIVISTKTSGCIEAWAAGLPVLFHRGPAIDPQSLFWWVPKERWFSSPQDLCQKVDALLIMPNLDPEQRLLEACFGPDKRPRRILPFIDHLVDENGSAPLTNA